MVKDDLGNRMKENYENRSKTFLVRRMPVIIRLDGKAFHTFTRGMRRPFDDILIKTMQQTAQYLCENIQGCKIAYTQSDEITLLLIDYEKITTDAWFDYNVQKMSSISASMATLAFNKYFRENVCCNSDEVFIQYRDKFDKAMFDSRVFNIPKEEVCNCFIWRQQDATKNAISMVGFANFSNKQLHKLNGNQVQELLWQEKGINFNDFETFKKRGSCIVKKIVDVDGAERSKWEVDIGIPIFSKERDYIEKYL